MMRFYQVLALAGMIGVACGADPATDHKKLLKECVAQRRGIQSAHAVLHAKYMSKEVGSNEVVKFDRQEEIWFDQDHLRGDRALGSDTVVRCFGCYGPQNHVWFSTETQNGIGYGVAIDEIRDLPPISHSVPDMRALGMIPQDCLTTMYFSFDTVFDDVEVGEPETVMLDGTECVRIDGTGANNSTWTFWVDTARGPNIIRAVQSYESDGLTFVDTVDSTLTQSDDVWYPSDVSYRRTINGTEATTEALRIDLKSVNTPIDAGVFSLAGIEAIPKTRPVNWLLDTPPPGKGLLLWNGEEIVPAGRVPGGVEYLDEIPEGSSGSRFALLSGAMLLVVGFVLFVRQRRAA